MIWILCIFTLFLSSCDQKPQATTYKEVVIQAPQIPATSQPAVQPMPSDQSGMPAADPHAGLDMPQMGAGMPSDNSTMGQLFTWSAPEGWQQMPASGMRLATLHLSADDKAIDCSLVALGGMAGGLEANLRRWMGQIGVEATPEQLSGLIAAAGNTSIKSGQGGKVFDFTTIQSKALPTAKSMIVVMVPGDEATLFVKMTGTIDTVNQNKDGFFKLVGSVEYHAPQQDQSAQPAVSMPDATGAMNTSAADPHAGLNMAAMGGLIEAPTSQNLLTWQAPEGWSEEPGKHMRMVSFHAAADPKAIDCYIIGLAGPAGGAEANLQRWLGQLGLDPSDDNVKALMVAAQTVNTKDGLACKVFDFTAMQAKAPATDKSMLAAMIGLDKTTVFVKMTGSMDAIKNNRDNFLKLLGSIARK